MEVIGIKLSRFRMIRWLLPDQISYMAWKFGNMTGVVALWREKEQVLGMWLSVLLSV